MSRPFLNPIKTLSSRPKWRDLSSFFLATFFLLLLALPASAQGPATGTPPFGSFSGGPDIINNANLNTHLSIPVLHKPGRGTNFTYDLSYDSAVWTKGTSGSTTLWQPVYNWGWRGRTEVATGYISYSTGFQINCGGNGIFYTISNWVYHDAYGVAHPFAGQTTQERSSTCGNSSTSFSALAKDSSGLTLNATGFTGSITTSTGSIFNPPAGSGTGASIATDRNGNQISVNSSGQFFDTLSSANAVLAVSGSGTASSPTVFTYTAPSGSSAPYTINYTNYTVATNFGISGIGEYKSSAAVPLITSIVLPDSSQYTFTYEPTPSTPSAGACTPYAGTTCTTARLQSVSLPTGGTISYIYYNNGGNFTACTVGNNGIYSDGSASCLQRTTPDGISSYIQTKGTAAATTTLVTDATSNQTKIQFQGIYETERQTYQGSTSGTLLSQADTCYNTAAIPCFATAITLPITQRAVQTSIPSAGSITLVGKNVTTYSSVGAPTQIDQYTFGSGSAPTMPSTKTLITYASLPPNITAFKQQVQVTNGSGALLAQTTNNYDETTPVAAPTGTPQLTSVTGSRGNLTSVQRCTNLSSCTTSPVTSTMTYDTAGQLQSVKDPLLNQTTFSYTDNYLDDDGSNPPSHTHTTSAPTDAFATTITPPMNGAVTLKYYYSGQLALSTDQNGNNNFSHFDSLGRLTSSYGPTLGTNRPWLLNVYASSDTQADSYLNINDSSTTAIPSCSVCRHDEVLLDGLGRPTTQQLVSDPEGATTVDTTYDSRGQVKTVSHAHRSTSSLTDGIETPTYDALGRTIKVTHPDTTFSQSFYGPTVTAAGGIATQLCTSGTYGLGFPVLLLDESGRKRQTWTDGYGRTIEGDEPDGTGALTSYVCYSYDPLGNLLQVVHSLTPSQTRTYAYDALSRVTSVTIPERADSTVTNHCPITFTYDSDSNLKSKAAPAPNQNASCTTGAVTTTYSYDALNRLTGKTYSDTTPAVKYGYDATAITGCTTAPPTLTDSNPKGRMTAMCDSSGATSWAHDAAGKILTEKRTILGVTQTISYSYNLDGSINTITYPSGKQVAYTVSNAQRLTSAKDPATGGAQYAFTASYGAIGALQSMITGQVSGGFGGLTESHTYNQSLEYTSTKATSTAGTAMDLSLAYSLAGGDNGTVTAITNNQDTGRNQTFTYDPLNRILKAVSQAASGVDCWGQTFGPDGNAADDSVANLFKMNSGTQANPPCPLGTLSVTVDANNHVTGTSFAYDAMGNMTGDGQSGVTYSFDDENRIAKITGVAGGPWCYIYDGNGLRVAKKSGAASDCSGGTITKIYWRSIAGDSLTETDGTGSVTANYSEYVLFAGRRIASRVTGSASANTAVFYYFADQLGSTRTITTGSGKNNDGSSQTPGQLCYDSDFSPYGQEISFTARLQTTACTPSYKFTGYERDSETGLDYAFARYYSSRLARFMSTDPLAGSIGSLQSHNAYAYTHNNPLNRIDTSGMVDCQPGEGCWALPDGGGSGLGGGMPTYYGPNNPANGFDFGDITNGAAGQSDREIARDIAAENIFSFTAIGPFFDAMQYYEDWLSNTLLAAKSSKDKDTADCIAKGLTKYFGATVTMGASTGEVGGHWNFGVQLSFSSYNSALAFTASYNSSAANGWAPPARFFDGPALHLENLGNWSVSNGMYSVNGTSHIDLYNPDDGAGGVAGHVAVDGLWGHIVQAFGGDIDPSTCPF